MLLVWLDPSVEKGCEENDFCYCCHFPYCSGLSRKRGCSSDHCCVRNVLSDMDRHQQAVRMSTGAEQLLAEGHKKSLACLALQNTDKDRM